MLYNEKNGRIAIDNTDMDYISFGHGDRTIVMISGMADGLHTVYGTATEIASAYSGIVDDFTVYVFSDRNLMPAGFTTRDMADDVYYAMKRCGIDKAYVLGVSLGGMIAQYLAINHPEAVEKLILTVTLAKPNETRDNVIGGWVEMAKNADYKSIVIDIYEKMYSEEYLNKVRPHYADITGVGIPDSFDRFITMGEACIAHNSYDELKAIKCPTLIIGGMEDKVLTAEASEEIAEQIAGSELYLYKGLGHGAYEERIADFTERFTAFCKQ